jgi:hypothetical protein
MKKYEVNIVYKHRGFPKQVQSEHPKYIWVISYKKVIQFDSYLYSLITTMTLEQYTFILYYVSTDCFLALLFSFLLERVIFFFLLNIYANLQHVNSVQIKLNKVKWVYTYARHAIHVYSAS